MCLKNQRILFIGDSTSQEMFIELVSFLEESHDQFILNPWKIWTCPGAHVNYQSRMMSTSTYPSPYLIMNNISIDFLFNANVNHCENYGFVTTQLFPQVQLKLHDIASKFCLNLKKHQEWIYDNKIQNLTFQKWSDLASVYDKTNQNIFQKCCFPNDNIINPSCSPYFNQFISGGIKKYLNLEQDKTIVDDKSKKNENDHKFILSPRSFPFKPYSWIIYSTSAIHNNGLFHDDYSNTLDESEWIKWVMIQSSFLRFLKQLSYNITFRDVSWYGISTPLYRNQNLINRVLIKDLYLEEIQNYHMEKMKKIISYRQLNPILYQKEELKLNDEWNKHFKLLWKFMDLNWFISAFGLQQELEQYKSYWNKKIFSSKEQQHYWNLSEQIEFISKIPVHWNDDSIEQRLIAAREHFSLIANLHSHIQFIDPDPKYSTTDQNKTKKDQKISQLSLSSYFSSISDVSSAFDFVWVSSSKLFSLLCISDLSISNTELENFSLIKPISSFYNDDYYSVSSLSPSFSIRHELSNIIPLLKTNQEQLKKYPQLHENIKQIIHKIYDIDNNKLKSKSIRFNVLAAQHPLAALDKFDPQHCSYKYDENKNSNDIRTPFCHAVVMNMLHQQCG